jgi:hypothetical protein
VSVLFACKNKQFLELIAGKNQICQLKSPIMPVAMMVGFSLEII